jgi:hypothetical protein
VGLEAPVVRVVQVAQAVSQVWVVLLALEVHWEAMAARVV